MKKDSYILLFFFFVFTLTVYSQQTIGSFPAMDGGLEAVSVANLSGSLSSTVWSVSSTSNGVHAVSTTGGRSGPKYLTFSYTSTSTKRLQSPSTTSPQVMASTQYTVQFHYKTSGATGPTNMRLAVGTNGTSNNSYLSVTMPGTNGTWTKVAGQVTSSSTQGTIGWSGIQANGTMGAVSIDFDDFCLYAGTTDATAPDPATSPTTPSIAATQITVSWTAPGTGVDGGGYLVVRGTSDPTTAPNANGIYAVGNTVAAGEQVVYIGTGTSFTDVGLSPTTTYYYRIYTVDKAFNYSTGATVNATTSTPSFATEPTLQASNITFSDITSSAMTINWTSGDGSNRLVVVRASTDVNAAPSDGGSYTANTAYGSGSQVGSGNFVVYNGTGSSVTMTGLAKVTKYYVKIYEFNGSGGTENYLISSPASANQSSLPGEISSTGANSAGASWATAGTWAGGVVPTSSDNVTIVAGDKIAVASSQNCYNLTVQAGARVYNNTALPTSTLQYLNVYGPSIVVDGKLGDKILDESADGAMGINFYNDLTFSGTGTIRPCRLRPGSGVQNKTVTFASDAEITYTGGTGTGGSGFYADQSGNDNISLVINSGVTLSGVVNCNFATSSSTGTDGTANTSILVNGTLNIPGGILGLRVASGKTCSLTVNGTLNIGKDLIPTGTTGQVSVLTVNSGGVVNMTGATRTAFFDTPGQTITGAGTFNLNSGAGISVGAPEGLDPVNGPVRTAIRNFSTGANYSFTGTSAQVVGSDFPATVNNLTISNTAGVTASGNTQVDGVLGLTNGVLSMGANTLTLGTSGSVSRTSGYVAGKFAKNIPTGATSVTYEVGTANGYSPVSIAFGNVGTADYITASATQSTHANATTPSNTLQRHWTMTPGVGLAFDNYNATFTYLAADFNTGVAEATDEATLVVGKYNGSNWSFPTIGTRTTGGAADGGSIQVTGLTSFSDFGIGKDIESLPVELTSFVANVKDRAVTLKWETATEQNSAVFEVERETNGMWVRLSSVKASGNSHSPKAYSFVDNHLQAGTWHYRLKMVDNDGTFSYSNTIEATIELPKEYALMQNYPNPFNPSTKVEFQLPQASALRIDLYTVTGEKIATLINGIREAGYHSMSVNARQLGLQSGVYLYRIEAKAANGGVFTQTRKMLLTK